LATVVKSRTDYNTISNFSSSLASEISSRQSADTKLTNDLFYEKGRAFSQEDILNASISSEAKTRSDADINKLTNDLASAVLDRAIIQEQKDRKTADDALGVRIDEEKTRAEGVEFAHFAYLDDNIKL
jgi:hypothetical protein